MPRRPPTDISQLSLFDESDPAATPRGAPAPGASVPVPQGAVAPVPGGAPAFPNAVAPASATIASAAACVPLADLLAPAVFRHPQADREIRLDTHVVAYALRRARRRSIGFVVGVEGLAVSAPRWVGVADIEAALREKAAWILRKLREQQERAQRQQAARVDWRDGATIPFLGEMVIIVLDARATGAVLHTDAQALPGVPRLTLHVGLPHTASGEQIRDAVQSFAQQLRVRCTRLSLSSAQTRWGSASADGSIRLNWRLVHFAPATIDYVVTHELAHLREMNHGPRFWDVVRSVLPDYERARGTLRDDVLPVFD
jgi:predicted metal-dependent hydrolase